MRPQHAMAAVLFAALSVAMTWPLAANLATATTGPGDAYINVWILDWDWYQTFRHPLALFDANVFHPARYALAFSENLFGVALLLFPLRVLGASPIAAYNVAMLTGYAFSGFAMYLLGRYVTASWWAGIAAGIFYAFLPYRFTQAAHVQHVWGGWLPMLLLALLHYAKRPTWRRAALFGAAFLINGLTNIHWLLFGAFAIAVTVVVIHWPDMRDLARLAVCGALAAALLLPFLLPYESASELYGMQREWQETKRFSALPSDWLTSDPTTRWYAALAEPRTDAERWLFPGALSLVIAAVAMWDRRRLRSGEPETIAVTWLALGLLGSFGLHTIFHRFLFSYVPGFRAIRVPARWAMIAYVGLAILVAIGVAALERRRRWLAPAVALLFVVELHAAPRFWMNAVAATPPAYAWLAAQSPSTAVLELPIDEHGSEYGYMLAATAHHRPIVNGTSGFAPPETLRITSYAHANPVSPKLLPELRRIGLSYVLVHADFIDARTREWLRRALDAGELHFARRFDHGIYGDWIFGLASSPNRQAPSRDLQAFLDGVPTRNEFTFGALDTPVAGETIPLHGGFFSGYALSPHGVREVNLLFAAGRVRVPALLKPDAFIASRFPWYPATATPRFVRALPNRPAGVPFRTDVQVEIVDGRGERTYLESRAVQWRD